MTKPFVYDEKTSSLYSPDGGFIKNVFCPKALNWNQLIANDPLERSRGCQQCGDDVINLDVMSVAESMQRFESGYNTCAYASSNSPNVIFIKDLNSPELRKSKIDTISWANTHPIPDLPRISTARNIQDIQRASSIGFWPDVRALKYKDREIQEKLGIYQNKQTGEVMIVGDYRSLMDIKEDGLWDEVIPVTFYYSNYQKSPFAAYLIPNDLPDGSAVFIPDPIEDILGSTWNQGDRYRAMNVTGTVIDKKVVIDPANVEQSNFMG
ncbi:hypothetical protein [Polynucleobacter sp. AP-Ainpum-60-G11]|uniref:hypothetical protein n=1 Tax=Polynucleobacter sp. AP-Ainpum-60-G11 TaxID=2576926 RepID=UPI001BFD8A61|nr:hypothetical protein [Polynucleobacter sp. AP-Ainpum-60-G11]QWE25987.1 hypothetical protein FD971_05860 [Polynucleobacter sp. AP-Ainpum-60-G11]